MICQNGQFTRRRRGGDIQGREVSGEKEIFWLWNSRSVEDSRTFLVVEVHGRVIASSGINRQRRYEEHVGVVNIVIKKGSRDIGVGTTMISALLEHAKKIGLKVLTLPGFAGNERASHTDERVKFVQSGVIFGKHLKDGKI